MGFRYRKSKKIGPFRVTASKSGIGYSVGGKGFRVTKKAGGGIRTTASIPGTGISYVKDYGSGKSRKTSTRNSGYNFDSAEYPDASLLEADSTSDELSVYQSENTQMLIKKRNKYVFALFVLVVLTLIGLPSVSTYSLISLVSFICLIPFCAKVSNQLRQSQEEDLQTDFSSIPPTISKESQPDTPQKAKKVFVPGGGLRTVSNPPPPEDSSDQEDDTEQDAFTTSENTICEAAQTECVDSPVEEHIPCNTTSSADAEPVQQTAWQKAIEIITAIPMAFISVFMFLVILVETSFLSRAICVLMILIALPVRPLRKFWAKLKIKGVIKLLVLFALFTAVVAFSAPSTDDNGQLPTEISTEPSYSVTENTVLPTATDPSADIPSSAPVTVLEPTEAAAIETTVVPTEDTLPTIVTEPPVETTEATTPAPTYVTSNIKVPSSQSTTTSNEQKVWIPTNGGTKYHRNSGCSNMINPQYVTISQAKNQGFTACKKCY